MFIDRLLTTAVCVYTYTQIFKILAASTLNMAQQPVIWKKRILVPFWIVRILAMIFVIAIYAYALKVLRDQGTSREYPAMG